MLFNQYRSILLILLSIKWFSAYVPYGSFHVKQYNKAYCRSSQICSISNRNINKIVTTSSDDSSSFGPLSITKAICLLEGGNLSTIKATMYIEGILIQSAKIRLTNKNWRKLLAACIDYELVMYAMDVYRRAVEAKVDISSQYISKLLTFLCSKGYYDQSKDVLNHALSIGSELTIHCYSTLIKYSRSASEAFDFLLQMELSGIQPNVISYTAAIKCCETNNDLASALMILDLMRINGVAPNEVTYSCVITVAAKSFAGEVALSVVREMQSSGFPPNPLCFCGALFACARSGMWTEVEYLVNQMGKFRIPLEESVLISIISSCKFSHIRGKLAENPKDIQWAKAIWLLDTYINKTVHVTDSVFTICMSVCEDALEYSQILKIHYKMTAFGIKTTKSSLNYLLRAHIHFRDSEKMIDLLDLAKTNDLSTVSLYRSAIDAFNRFGLYHLSVKCMKEVILLHTKPHKSINRVLNEDETRITEWFVSLADYQQRKKIDSDINSKYQLLSHALKDLCSVLTTLIPTRPFLGKENPFSFMLSQPPPRDTFHLILLAVLRGNNSFGLKLYERIISRQFSHYKMFDMEYLPGSLVLELSESEDLNDMYLLQKIAEITIRYAECMVGLTSCQEWDESLHDLKKFPVFFTTQETESLSIRTEDKSQIQLFCKLCFDFFEIVSSILKKRNISQIGNSLHLELSYLFHKYNYVDGLVKVYNDAVTAKLLSDNMVMYVIATICTSKKLASTAVLLFEKLQQNNPDTIFDVKLYDSVFLASRYAGNWQFSMNLFRRLQITNVPLSSSILENVLLSCASGNQVHEFFRVLGYMKASNMSCSYVIDYVSIIMSIRINEISTALFKFYTIFEDEESLMRRNKKRGDSKVFLERYIQSISNNMVDAKINRGLLHYQEQINGDQNNESFPSIDVDIVDLDDEMDIFTWTDKSWENNSAIVLLIICNILSECIATSSLYNNDEKKTVLDDIYEKTLRSQVINPLQLISSGMINISNHSTSMMVAAIRYIFLVYLRNVDILSKEPNESMTGENQVKIRDLYKMKSLTIFMDRNPDGQKAVQSLLRSEFQPSLRCFLTQSSYGGKLTIPGQDLRSWIESSKP